MKLPHLSSLTPERQAFLRLLQRVSFGRIEGLFIRNGDPVLTPKPRILKSVKFGRESAPRPEAAIDDFALKKQVIEMFEHFDRLRDGTVASLDLKEGVPCQMVVDDSSSTGA